MLRSLTRFSQVPKERALLGLVTCTVFCCLSLHAYWSLRRERHFSHDSMIYVQVARNWMAGRGLSAEVLYYPAVRYPASYDFPQPSTQFPPLYPLSIAMVARLGFDPADAALLVPVAALGGVLWSAFSLMTRLYDLRTALLSLLLLLLSHPLDRVSSAAWSETLALFLFLLSLLASTRARSAGHPVLAHFVAGLLGGMSFATRYAFALALPFGVLLASTGGPRRRGAAQVLAFTVAWAVPALPVMLRSLMIEGYPMGPLRPPSVIPLSTNAVNVARALAGHYASQDWEGIQLVLLGAGALAFPAWIHARARRGGPFVRDLFLSEQRFVLPLWIAAYVASLLWAAARVNLPLFDVRLIAPASVVLMLVAAVAVAAASPGGVRSLCALVTLVAVVKSAGLTRAIASSPPTSARKQIRESARLRWVERETTPADLIVGDDAHDIAFYFDRRVLSFDYFMHSTEFYRISEPGLCIVLSWMRCEQYGHVYVVLRDRVRDDPRWRREPFLSDLVGGRLEAHRHLVPVRRVGDGFIFRWICAPCDHGAAGPAVSRLTVGHNVGCEEGGESSDVDPEREPSSSMRDPGRAFLALPPGAAALVESVRWSSGRDWP